eukprot:m.99254 g.99254  ORF g.99254 m.99254 type:complete len:66 (+) comp37051_c1_seq11:489-686(+)
MLVCLPECRRRACLVTPKQDVCLTITEKKNDKLTYLGNILQIAFASTALPLLGFGFAAAMLCVCC